MAGEGEQIHWQRAQIDRQMAHRLDGVCMEDHLLFTADGAQFGNRLNGADLVIGVHDGHESRVFADRAAQLLRPHQTVLMHVQQRDLKPLCRQFFQRVQYGVMLKSRGDDVPFALLRAQRRHLSDRPIVRFTAAGGEIDLLRLGVQCLRHRLPRLLYQTAGLLPKAVETGRIAVSGGQSRQHSLKRRLAYSCCGGIIHINVHDMTFFLINSYCNDRIFLNILFVK